METITIEYNAAVFTQAGFRSVTVTAQADRISPKRAKVVEVTLLDGEAPVGTLSRTGAKRQQYYAGGVAQREIGKIKNLSACNIIGE